MQSGESVALISMPQMFRGVKLEVSFIMKISREGMNEIRVW